MSDNQLSKEQLQAELERAATSLLTDDEIVESLGITHEILNENYVHVSKARLKLKQRLNAKRINDAAQSGETAAILENIPRNRILYKGEGHGPYTHAASGRGGAREGAGRKPGQVSKITGQSILNAVFARTGEKFEDLLAEGYAEAIENRDKITRMQYEKLFLSKVVSDRVDIDVSRLAEITDDQLKIAIRLALEEKQKQDQDQPPIKSQ